MKLDPEVLRTLLRYDADTGKLFWSERSSYSWNRQWAGREAFTAKNEKGYMRGGIFGKVHYAHRVIWAIVHGEWPNGEIDHINGNQSDNRIANLRCVTKHENMRNQSRPKTNTSGVLGVSLTRHGKWDVQIKANGRVLHLGQYADFDEAAKVRREANVKYGFHENHGRA
jgi:hypothetical protein